MLPGEYYKQRLTSLQIDLNLLIKKKSTLAWLRFAAIAGIAAVWYFLIPFGLWYVLIPGFLLLVLFTRLIFADLKNKSAIEYHKILIKINEDELQALTHNYYHFAGGQEFIHKEHFYANDLDIFGHASLYQYINRTGSEMGNSTLANWLSNPSKPKTVLERQEAVKELVSQTAWRQQLQAFGAAEKLQKATQNRLQDWFAEDNRFMNNKLWLLIRYLIPAVMLTVIILNITDVVGDYIRNYCLLASALLAFYISKKVTPLHNQVSKMTDELEVLSDSIQLIEQTGFTSTLLQDLQKGFKQQHEKASSQLIQLKKILERLDLRFNIEVKY